MADEIKSAAPTPESKPAETPAAPVRRSAVRDIQHKAPPTTNRGTKDAIAAKMGDKLDKAVEAAGGATEGGDRPGKRIRHKIERTTRSAAPATKPDDRSITGPKGDTENPTDAPTAGDRATTEESAAHVSSNESDKPALEISAEERRSLNNYGFDDSEIDKQSKDNPAAFAGLVKMAHTLRKKEVESYARLGQQKGQPVVPAPVNVPAAPGEVTEEEVTQFEKLHPNDPAAAFIAKNARAQISFRAQQRAVADQANMAALQNQVDSFFGGEGMKSYAKHYEDINHKNKVIETAAAIVAGANIQGRKLSLNEALTMAHDSTAAPIVKEAARKEIISEVKQRNDALTQRSVGGAKETGATNKKGAKVLSRKEIEDRVGARLAALK